MRRSVIVGVMLSLWCLTIDAQLYDMFGAPAPVTKTVAPKQDNINQTDAQGRKQGPWQKNYTSGKPAYTATFKDNKPVGEMVRYYPSGNVSARIVYDDKGETGRAELFDEKKTLIGKGNYKGTLRDSVWLFYSAKDLLASSENYVNGRRNGKSTTYYRSGKVSEIIIWLNDTKEGNWEQYHETGGIKIKSQHQNGNIHGTYVSYYANGAVEMQGQYFNGMEDGIWQFFFEDGKLNYQLEFDKGKPKNKEMLEAKEKALFEEFERNRGRLTDPEQMRNNPDAVLNGQ